MREKKYLAVQLLLVFRFDRLHRSIRLDRLLHYLLLGLEGLLPQSPQSVLDELFSLLFLVYGSYQKLTLRSRYTIQPVLPCWPCRFQITVKSVYLLRRQIPCQQALAAQRLLSFYPIH